MQEQRSVFYYNKWRGVDLPELKRCFRQLSAEEIANLKEGDEVWFDNEPYHLNGKVYGFTQSIYHGKEKSGSRQLFRCINPEGLESLILEYGDLVLSPISEGEKRAFETFSQSFESGNFRNN